MNDRWKRGWIPYRRYAEGKTWWFTGRSFDGWLEIQSNPLAGRQPALRYCKESDYRDEANRYPDQLPVYRIEKLLWEGVQVA